MSVRPQSVQDRNDDECEDAPPAIARKGYHGRIRRVRRRPEEEGPYQSWTAFTEALMNPLCNSEVLGQCPEGTKTSGPTRVTDVRASFARNYGARGGLAKSADAQRQAFTRALKAALAEGLVSQDSWDGADWLWREDE